MSDSEERSEHEELAMPKYRIRFTDMPLNVVENVVRSKFKAPKLTIFCFIVCEATNKKHNLDKQVATEIQGQLCTGELTEDGCAGWHVICGKHFALSITYNTKWTCFFDLLEGCNKTFLVFKTQ
jgi:hypothetical protein